MAPSLFIRRVELWLYFALGTALFESCKNLASKLALRHIAPLIVALASRLFALPLMFVLLLLRPAPVVLPGFNEMLVVGGVLGAVNIALFFRAIKLGELSQTEPLMNFTPLFLLLTAPIFLQEVPSPLGVAGVLLVVVGAYVLNLRSDAKGFWAPLKTLLSASGPRLMLLVAFISSLTTLIDKRGVLLSNVYFWALFVNITYVLLFSLWMMRRLAEVRREIASYSVRLLLIGLLNGLSSVSMLMGMELAQVSYVISVKRLSTLFSVWFGAWLLGEPNVRMRLTGAGIMIAGVVLITFS